MPDVTLHGPRQRERAAAKSGTPGDGNDRGERAGPRRPSGEDVRWGYRDLEVALRYDRRRYGGVAGGLRAVFVGRAIRRALQAGGFAHGIVLDVACGTGIAARAAARANARWIGVDISAGMLRVARRHRYGRRHLWVRADLEHLPFRASAPIDAIVCLRFLAHLPPARWAAILGPLARMTAGPVVVGLPMRHSSKHWWRAFKRWLGVRSKRRPVFAADVVAEAFRAAGLECRHRIWQSPFTDTALVVARRAGEHGVPPSGSTLGSGANAGGSGLETARPSSSSTTCAG